MKWRKVMEKEKGVEGGGIEEVEEEVVEVMKERVCDGEGKVGDELMGGLDEVGLDREGVGLMERMGGMVLFEGKGVENGVMV